MQAGQAHLRSWRYSNDRLAYERLQVRLCVGRTQQDRLEVTPPGRTDAIDAELSARGGANCSDVSTPLPPEGRQYRRWSVVCRATPPQPVRPGSLPWIVDVVDTVGRYFAGRPVVGRAFLNGRSLIRFQSEWVRASLHAQHSQRDQNTHSYLFHRSEPSVWVQESSAICLQPLPRSFSIKPPSKS